MNRKKKKMKENFWLADHFVVVPRAPVYRVRPIQVETKYSKFQHLVIWLGAYWLAEFGRAEGKICSYRCTLHTVHTLWLRAKYFPSSAPPLSQWVHIICQHQCLPHAKQFASIQITFTRNFPRTLHEAMFDLMFSYGRITCSTVKRVLYFQKAAYPGWMSAAVRGSERSSTS